MLYLKVPSLHNQDDSRIPQETINLVSSSDSDSPRRYYIIPKD